jgi:hypothetical protein
MFLRGETSFGERLAEHADDVFPVCIRGQLQPWAATYLKLTVEIVKRPGNRHTFEVLPRRWVVERTLAWITGYRRCARDYERLTAHHEALGHDDEGCR